MSIKKVSMLILTLVMGISSFAQFDANKTYTIANNNDANAFIQEKDDGGVVVAVGAMNNNSYWMFEATGNEDCYYVKNARTGKYLQDYEKTGDEIKSGDNPVEYYIKADASGSYTGKYRFAITSLSPHDFADDSTLGINWKGAGDASCGYDCIQAFASAAGGRPRSAWIVTQKDMPAEPFSIKEGKVYEIRNNNDDHPFLKDRRTGTLLVESGETNAYGLWTFVPTGKTDCFYMKNVLTGNYVQTTKNNEVEIEMGTAPVEIMAKNDPAKGEHYFGFASTDQGNLSFENDQTFGINWKNNGTGQGFPVTLGGRPRSFWIVTEVPVVKFDEVADNNADIDAAADKEQNSIISRTMIQGMWNTAVVPFNMTADDISKNFGAESVVAEFDNESDGVMHFISTETIEAGKPYLVLPTVDVVSIITMNTEVKADLVPAKGDTYDYVGVYAPTSIGSNDDFLAADNKLKKNNNSNGKLKAFRAYFKNNDNGAKDLTGFDIDGESTGIAEIEIISNKNTKIYNVSGQQMNPNSMQKGIFIMNGKKIVKK